MKLKSMIQVESSVDFLPPIVLIPENNFENFILWLNTKLGYDIRPNILTIEGMENN
jgi:hypothetical protein